MNTKRQAEADQALILIAPGFDEGAIVVCVRQLRQYGMAIKLVGTSAHYVTGQSGLMVHPDCSLSQIELEIFYLLIIPGGDTCTIQLLSDPRTYRIVQSVIDSGNRVAVMSSLAAPILTSVGILTTAVSSQFLTQGSQKTADFIQQLLS
jgi:hypothetical protein